ncbi:MAG: glycosyltransferase family 25 protein [Conchiformibius sp.]|nr:glycosyltransferase family 25 protein [Conchiformibius sp.]
MLHNHVSSIATAEHRRQHIRREFERHAVPFQFSDAQTPSEPLKEHIRNLLPQLASAPLTDGEKACFISHILLWHDCIQQNLPYIAVFEDDVVLGKRSADFLCDDAWLKQRFADGEAFIIRLETFLMPVKSRPCNIADHGGSQFKLADSVHWGAAAYILSQAAARKLLADFAQLDGKELDAVDMLMFNRYFNDPTLTVYQISPAVCIQEPQLHRQHSTLNSQLEDERYQNQQKLKQAAAQNNRKTLKQRILRALTKPARMREKRRYHIIPFE